YVYTCFNSIVILYINLTSFFFQETATTHIYTLSLHDALPISLNMPKETWLKLRKKGIGGSDASSILNLNPYKSSVNVYMEKIDENIEINNNMKMILGEKLEEFVAKEFCNETSKKVRNLNGILRNHKYPYAIANLDKVVVGENAFLECVVTNSFCKKIWSEEVPINYQIQCYHYMAVTGATHCYVCALIGNEEIK